MSDVWGGSLPILYGRSVATGELVHVDDAPNGKACGCVCPDPGCGQPLIARNNGKKKIHHFAHIGGTCAWSAEYLLAKVKELGDQAWRAYIERKEEERRKAEEERERKRPPLTGLQFADCSIVFSRGCGWLCPRDEAGFPKAVGIAGIRLWLGDVV